MKGQHHKQFSNRRRRGVAAILAMMFLVIFGSLATAMAIVSQGNLYTAESHLKINRTLAAAETGMQYLIFRLDEAAQTVLTRDGVIDDVNAPDLWDELSLGVLVNTYGNAHNDGNEPYQSGDTLHLGPIALGAGQPTFIATLTPHPLTGENYDSAYYQREPYNAMTPPVSSTDPLDSTWIRVRVVASDGGSGTTVNRSIQMDFKLDKKIRFALLSKSRVMIGRNVLVDGPVGSRYTDTHIANGHPIQMEDNFRGLDATLDTALDGLIDTMIDYDSDHDNRINLYDAAELPSDPTDLANLQAKDANGDGYVDSYDLFLNHYDANADNQLSATELDTANNQVASELMELIDTFGKPSRQGYNDGFIDDHDPVVKVQGDVQIVAAENDWSTGLSGDPNQDGTGSYRDYFEGAILPGYNESAVTFQSTEVTDHDYTPADFDMTSFKNTAEAADNFTVQANNQASLYNPSDPNSPQPLGAVEREAVPYGAAYPYDYYDRPVYENMTFTDVKIPKGTNALFKNCTFIGVTFVETSTFNDDDDFNYVGMMEADGTLKHPGMTATVNGNVVADTKTESNNIRFHDCTFEGSVVSDSPPAYTHVRNKVAFTGETRFDIQGSTNLNDTEKALYQRSTILTPHYSIEMGTFDDPTNIAENVELTGTIVAGVLDMRGRIKIEGTILTTFEPVANQAPLVDTNTAQFNTTLGYFGSDSGDLEAELPGAGLGMIQLTYDESLALPDGINSAIEIRPVASTYYEGGY